MDLQSTHRARTTERMLAVGHALTDDLVFCATPASRAFDPELWS